MSNKNLSKKEVIIIDSITATISAMAIDIIYPPFLPIVILLKLASFFGFSFVIWTLSKYDKVFKNLNLFKGQAIPILKYKTITDYSTIYHFTLPAGLSLTDFQKNEEAIQNYVGKDIHISYTFKEITIEEFNDKMKSKYDYIPTKLKGNVPIIIGYTRKGELISCDLANGEPHMLIAGPTGGGKSTALRCILTNLILNNDVKLHLVDLKNGVELRCFSNLQNTLSFSRNIKDARSVLEQLDIEVDTRYDIFYKTNSKDILDYNSKHKNSPLDYQLLVVDEFADLQSDKQSLAILDNLGRKARACGIHMILSTQRPDAKVLNGAIKSNIPTVLGLKTTNSTNSHIIIDDTGLEKLHGNGHGLFKRNGSITEIQVPFISVEMVESLLKSLYTSPTDTNKFDDKFNNKFNSSYTSDNIKSESFDSSFFAKTTYKSDNVKPNDNKSNIIIDTTCVEIPIDNININHNCYTKPLFKPSSKPLSKPSSKPSTTLISCSNHSNKSSIIYKECKKYEYKNNNLNTSLENNSTNTIKLIENSSPINPITPIENSFVEVEYL